MIKYKVTGFVRGLFYERTFKTRSEAEQCASRQRAKRKSSCIKITVLGLPKPAPKSSPKPKPRTHRVHGNFGTRERVTHEVSPWLPESEAQSWAASWREQGARNVSVEQHHVTGFQPRRFKSVQSTYPAGPDSQ